MGRESRVKRERLLKIEDEGYTIAKVVVASADGLKEQAKVDNGQGEVKGE
jgi:hypothetical protein